MPIHPGLPLGTRQAPTQSQNSTNPTSLGVTQSLSTDPGMAKRVVASITFVSGSSQLQASGGTFAAFAVGDTIEVEGSNLNNGTFLVNATDGSTYLQVNGGVKNEGPVAGVTVRAI